MYSASVSEKCVEALLIEQLSVRGWKRTGNGQQMMNRWSCIVTCTLDRLNRLYTETNSIYLQSFQSL